MQKNRKMAPTLSSDPMIMKYVISIMSYRHVARPPVKESCLEFANLKLANRKISYIIYMQHCCHIKKHDFIGIQIFQNRYTFLELNNKVLTFFVLKMRRNNVFPASQGLIQLNFRPKTFQVGIASNKCAFTNPYFSLEAKTQFSVVF